MLPEIESVKVDTNNPIFSGKELSASEMLEAFDFIESCIEQLNAGYAHSLNMLGMPGVVCKVAIENSCQFQHFKKIYFRLNSSFVNNGFTAPQSYQYFVFNLDKSLRSFVRKNKQVKGCTMDYTAFKDLVFAAARLRKLKLLIS